MSFLKITVHNGTFHTAPMYLEHQSLIKRIRLAVYLGSVLLMSAGPKSSYAFPFSAS